MAYRKVVLHVVLHHDDAETRRADGALVPVVELAPVLRLPLGSIGAVADWSQFGGEVCAPHLAHHQLTAIRDRLWRLGDTRLAAKAARFEARLTATTPGQLLYEEIWDALGYSANRNPMRALATLVPLPSLDATLTLVAPNQRRSLAQAILFGAAGFLPLSPHDALPLI